MPTQTAVQSKPIPRHVPELGPLLMIPVMCPICGETVQPQPDYTMTKGKPPANGKVHSLVYVHINEDKGCAWQCNSDTRATGQVLRIKEEQVLEILKARHQSDEQSVEAKKE